MGRPRPHGPVVGSKLGEQYSQCMCRVCICSTSACVVVRVCAREGTRQRRSVRVYVCMLVGGVSAAVRGVYTLVWSRACVRDAGDVMSKCAGHCAVIAEHTWHARGAHATQTRMYRPTMLIIVLLLP